VPFRAASLLGAALLLATGPVAAAAPGPLAAQQGDAPPSPVEVIRERNDSVQAVLEASGDSLSDATREQLKDVINGFIDFPALSARALGRHWDDRTAEEREEFTEVFRELIRNSSVRKLGVYRADSIVYREPEISGDEARVTTVAYGGRNDAEIVYEMHRTGEGWLATDIVIDGSSTVRTYRDSFNREISRTSYQAMVRRLKEKLEEEGRAEG